MFCFEENLSFFKKKMEYFTIYEITIASMSVNNFSIEWVEFICVII